MGQREVNLRNKPIRQTVIYESGGAEARSRAGPTAHLESALQVSPESRESRESRGTGMRPWVVRKEVIGNHNRKAGHRRVQGSPPHPSFWSGFSCRPESRRMRQSSYLSRAPEAPAAR